MGISCSEHVSVEEELVLSVTVGLIALCQLFVSSERLSNEKPSQFTVSAFMLFEFEGPKFFEKSMLCEKNAFSYECFNPVINLLLMVDMIAPMIIAEDL